jgi:hypothetical protein
MMEDGHKLNAIDINEQPFDPEMYQKVIGSLLHAVQDTRSGITYTTTILGKYAANPSILYWEAVKHQLRPPESIICYADVDLRGRSRLEQVHLRNYHLRPRNPCGLEVEEADHCGSAQSIMEAEMIATTYGKVRDGLNCVTTLNSSNFQSNSRHFRLRYHSIHEAVAKAEIEVMHMPGAEMLADALTKTLGGVKL